MIFHKKAIEIRTRYSKQIQKYNDKSKTKMDNFSEKYILILYVGELRNAFRKMLLMTIFGKWSLTPHAEDRGACVARE